MKDSIKDILLEALEDNDCNLTILNTGLERSEKEVANFKKNIEETLLKIEDINDMLGNN